MLQAEQENPTDSTLQKEQRIGVETESKQSKSARGGKRPGAGRKPNPVKAKFRGTSRATLMQAIEQVDPQLVADRINKLLQSKKEIIWLQTLNFIYDRKLGKATQDVNVSGGIVHAHIRDPELLGWPKEALKELASEYDEAFRSVARKFALDDAQDGPLNQTESKPAIEAEIVTNDAL
jgi:hypothetical protein